MGPLTTLLKLGATVFAIDIDRPAVWRKLIALTENSPGTLIFPVNTDSEGMTNAQLAESAGCNLLEQPAEITKWLVEAAEEHAKGKRVTVGMYGYLDAALHVKLALGADIVMEGMSKRYKGPVGKPLRTIQMVSLPCIFA